MSFRISHGDILKIDTQAIIRGTYSGLDLGPACEDLLKFRKENSGDQEVGETFITPAPGLQAEHIIHVESPVYVGGNSGEEDNLRLCYKNCLELAKKMDFKSVVVSLITLGETGFSHGQCMHLAMEEIQDFLDENEMDIILSVSEDKTTTSSEDKFPNFAEYLDSHFIQGTVNDEGNIGMLGRLFGRKKVPDNKTVGNTQKSISGAYTGLEMIGAGAKCAMRFDRISKERDEDFEKRDRELAKIINDIDKPFSTYLIELIESKGMTNAEVYNNGYINKRVFSKIKNDTNYHTTKTTCLCLCVGLKLNLEESKDLLARAGYALSSADIRDVIFSYFIENEHYNILDIDIKLEEYDVPCLIS